MTPNEIPTEAQHRARFVLLDDLLIEEQTEEHTAALEAVAWPDVDALAAVA